MTDCCETNEDPQIPIDGVAELKAWRLESDAARWARLEAPCVHDEETSREIGLCLLASLDITEQTEEKHEQQ
jgi:hypothetical protein